MTGTIFDIKEMAVHDGPGIRTTVFFKGCPLSCKWCHNPEGLKQPPQLMYKKARCVDCGKCMEKCEHDECQPYGRCIRVCPENCLEISGKKVDAKELAVKLKKTADVLGNSFGGFTFSGGEPLMQSAFLLELAEYLRSYHLCIETSGYAEEETFQMVVSKMDLVIMDIKLADADLHKKYNFIVWLLPYLKNGQAGEGFNLKGMIQASNFYQKKGAETKLKTLASAPEVSLPTAETFNLDFPKN